MWNVNANGVIYANANAIGNVKCKWGWLNVNWNVNVKWKWKTINGILLTQPKAGLGLEINTGQQLL